VSEFPDKKDAQHFCDIYEQYTYSYSRRASTLRPFIMFSRALFTTLPLEIREQIYGCIASSHTTQYVRAVYGENLSIPQYKTTTSPITATCRLIHNEYENVARKAITKVEFTITDMNFDQTIDYFRHKVNEGFLAKLRSNVATIHVNLVASRDDGCGIDIKEFYTWALFLISIKLEAVYDGEDAMWMALHISSDRDLGDECVIEDDSSESVRDNIEDIRDIAEALDKTRWRAYPRFFLKSYRP
jgi:hypothetical protein